MILKEKGDRYEKYIGRKFEEKNNIVIYNGLIQGIKDRGVDLIIISNNRKIINLVQCKNWETKQLELFHIENIYEKLNHYIFLESDIKNYQMLFNKQQLSYIKDIWSNPYQFKIIKTLFLSHTQMVNNSKDHLIKIQLNRFLYIDMKINICNLLQ